MANNLIDLPKIEDMTSSVFGKVDPFAQQKPTTATSLLGDFVKDANKPIELSAGAQKMVTEGLNAAQNVIELSNKTNAAIQNQIEASQAQQAAALKQQQAIQQQRVEQEKLRQAAIKKQEAEQKKLEKELKEKIKADPLKVAQPRANVLLNSPEYKAASTEKKKDMVASFLANQKTALAAEIKDPDLQTAVFNETQGLLYSQLNKDVDAIVNDGSHFFSDLKTSVASFSKGLLGGYEGSKAASISKDIDAIKSGTSAISNGNLLSETTRRQLTNYTIADKPLPQPLRNTIVNELAGKLTEQTAKADRYFQQQKDIKEGYSAEVKDSLANLGYTKAKKELELAKEGKQLTLAGQISEGIGAAKDNWYALSLDSITPMLASIGTGLIMRNAPAAATIAASSTAGGLFTSSDVVSSARDAILSADDAQLKRIKGWDAALAQAGGNKELARRNIATVAASDKAGVGFLMGAALSVFGPETLASLAVGKVLSRGAAQAAVGSAKTAVAKNAGLFGAGVVSEGLEEGATQYLANVAAAEADPMKDVGYNAGIGAVLGGVMSAAPTIASTTVDVLNARALNPNVGPTPSGQPAVSGDVLSDLVNERVGLLQNLADAGKLDTSSINKVLYEGLERIPSEVSPQGGTATGYSGRQAFFDAVYESDILQNRLTPAQQAEIKSYIATAFSDINTNPYDYAAKTAELLAFYASDANSASSDMTKDAIAVKTNNGAAVADPVLATATVQALQAVDPNINESTKERMLRWTTMIRPDIYERNPDLTEEQKNQLDRYMHDYIDVTPRRMTDAQVAQQQAGLNQVPPSTQPITGQSAQVQPLMGTNVPGTAAASSAQGSGNNLAQQTFTPTNLIQPAPQTSQSPSGSVAQSTGGNPVGQASQVATAPTASSGPLIGTGTTGQTNSGQSTGQPGSVTAPTPVSSGSTAAAPAERNANAQRPSTSNQGTTDVDLSALSKESRRFIEAYREIFDKGISNWTIGDFFAAGIKIFSVNNDNESANEIWENNTFLLPMITKLVTRGIKAGKSSSDILMEVNNLLMPDNALRTSGVMTLMAYIEYEQTKAAAQVQSATTAPAGTADVALDTTAETGQVADDVVISDGVIEATSLPYTRLAYDAKSGTTTRETGSSQIISIAGRPVILVTVNGIKIPFYRSTGLGGKTDVKSGKWYPVFGIGSDGWFNKTSGTTGINDYYGIPQLRQIAEHLDATISENDINTALTKSAVGTSSLSPQTYQLINQSFPVPPTVNGTANTLGTVQQNIDFVKSTLAAAPSVGTQSVDGAAMGIALPSGATAQVVTPIGRRVRAVTNDETLLSRIEPIFNDAAGRVTNEQLGRMMTAFTEAVRAGATDDQVVAAVQNALRPTTQTANVPRGQAELGISLNDPSVIGKEVVRRGERGILVRRGKNIYFVPYMGENDINVGTINTDATLQALGFTSVSNRGTRTTNQIANRTNQAGRESDAIWQDIYSALQPSATEQEVDSALETALQEPIVDVEAEFNEALDILTEYFNGDENAALDALETIALSDAGLLDALTSGDISLQQEAVLEAASMLESTKLYNDYQDALELAYEHARDLNEVNLLESAVSGLVENYPNVTDRIAILEDYVNNSGQPATSPSATVGPVTQATPEYILTTSSPNITGAVEQLLLPPSQRTGKRKLTSKSPAVKERIRKAAMSDVHVGSPTDRMFAYIDSSKLAVKREQNGVSTIGSLTRENGRIIFVPDDGALPSVEITGIDKMSTFNSYNKKSTVDTLTPTVPLHMTEGFINNRIPNYDSTAKTNAPTQKTRVSPIESVATQRAAETTATTADTTEAPAAQEVTRYSSGPIQLDGATAEVTRPTAPVPPAPPQPTAPDAFDITLSASTYSIPGLRRLQQRVDAGDTQAATLLHYVAKDMLTRLTGAIEGVELSSVDSYGLYKGDKEPSLGITVTVTNPDAIPELLAALAKFADNFNQQQVHVREDTNAEVGYDFGDGSFATPVYRVALNEPLSDAELNRIMTESGLVGLTANEQYLEFYYVGEVGSEKANEQIDEFFNSAERAQQLLGTKSSGVRRKTQRLYIYGEFGGIPYNQIASGLRTQSAAPESVTARRIAEDQVGRTIEPAAQQDITPQQRALQTQIRDDYEAMPMDDLSNPLVQRAYTELADEVKDQFLSMPIKVDLLSGQGEPYASSTEMRRDILDNNHLSIFATEPDTFGSDPSIDYSNHPLLQLSGIKLLDADGSIVEEGDARYNEPGKELLYNDLFRAVHDYYAHTVSPVAFGPKGEEAAWKNHMAMMRSPWAAWALTTETRGQNSWVNFSPGMENRPIQERPFAPQKTGLLPLQYSYTGNAQVDAKLDTLKTELSANEQQGSLAEPEPTAEPIAEPIATESEYTADFDNDAIDERSRAAITPELLTLATRKFNAARRYVKRMYETRSDYLKLGDYDLRRLKRYLSMDARNPNIREYEVSKFERAARYISEEHYLMQGDTLLGAMFIHADGQVEPIDFTAPKYKDRIRSVSSKLKEELVDITPFTFYRKNIKATSNGAVLNHLANMSLADLKAEIDSLVTEPFYKAQSLEGAKKSVLDAVTAFISNAYSYGRLSQYMDRSEAAEYAANQYFARKNSSEGEQQSASATPEPTVEPENVPAPIETTTVDAVSESTPADTKEFSSYAIKAVGNKKSLGDMNVSLSVDVGGNIYIAYGRGAERTTEVFDTKRKAVNFILRNDLDPDMLGDVDRRDYINTFIMGEADSARNTLLPDRKEEDAATIQGADVVLSTDTPAGTVQESVSPRDVTPPTYEPYTTEDAVTISVDVFGDDGAQVNITYSKEDKIFEVSVTKPGGHYANLLVDPYVEYKSAAGAKNYIQRTLDEDPKLADIASAALTQAVANIAAGKRADTPNSTQNNVETVPEAQLAATTTEARLDTVTPNQIKAAFARKLLTSEEKASLGVGELKGADLVAHVTDLLTSPQENLTDVQNSALDKIAGYVDKGFADRQLNRQKANRNTNESAGQKTVADVITTQERDVVDAFLESRNEEDVTAEDLVEQVISNRVNRDAPTDPLIAAAEADSRIKRIIDRIWNAIKNTVAVVAVALAAYTGIASNNDAYAATTPITVTSPIVTLTEDANAAHQYVQQNRDNSGKPYIIADKKGGAVHLFDARGNLLATTPALFGKNVSDTTRAGATPAGKFTIKYASTPAKGYGGTVQALANSSGQLVQSSIGTVSIHRTYTADSAENRPARLASKSVTDNRISNGCINVPSSFYNAHLDSAFDGYVYVLPETKASPYRPRGSDIITTTQRATELRAPTRATKTTTQTTVPASAVVSAQVAVEPVITETISTAPVTIEGTKPSGQVAMVKPVAVNGVSHSTMNVPQGTHTPLEQSTKPAFDTVAPDVTTESGWDIASVVLGVFGVLGGFGATGLAVRMELRDRKLASRRNATPPTLAQLQAPAAQQTPAAAVATTVTPQASTTPPAAPSPVPATPTASAAQQFKVNGLASAMHQAQWFDYMTRVGGLDEAVLQDLFFAETNLFRTMTDKSLQQALENDLQAKPWNVGDRLPGKLKGALGTIIYLTNGAKPALDNLLIKYGAPVVGVESDSPRFSMILSAIGGMANAAVREMTTANITPITKKLEKLSYKYRKGFQEVAEDFGRYATLDHLLSEGFSEHISAKEGEIDTYVQIMALQDAIIADPNSSAREVSAAQADRDIAARNRTRLENQLLIIRSTIEGNTTPIDRAVADQYLILTAHQTAMQIEVARYNRTIAAQDAVLSNPNASAKDKNAASKAKNSAIAQRDALTKRIDDIQDTIDSLPFVLDPALLQQATVNINSAKRADEIRQATTKLSQLVNARSKLVLDANNNVLWNGDTDANGNVVEGQVKMPGGYTRRQAQQEFDRLKSMYDVADLEGVAADIVKAYNRATIFAGASGVYRASDYERFKDIGFKKYVALYRKSLTPADLNPTNEENVESSELADLLRKYPTRQVRSLGLQDDVTRYSRDGSSEPAADAYTNLLLFTRQHGSLIAQAPLRREIELLYEGTWQNVNQTGVFSTKRLEELEQKGEIPGIVRYLPGKEPANLKDVRPISAWGHIADANGQQQYVRMNYYFTDTVIQEQIGRNITLGESADGNGLLGGIMAETRAYTRFASQLMTRFNPRFQLFTNVFNETWERATTAAFRDVVDVNGNPVSVTSLTASHAAHVAENMTIGKRREIYRYITTGEVKTKLQYVLHEMYGRGAIHLQTDLVEKQNMMEEYKKALSTRALDAAGNRLKRLANKSEVVGSAVDMSEDALDFMLMQLSEVTQVALVLASAQAYIDNGVNLAEASNRVRDSFDAMRAPNWQTKMGALFPFVRATMSGVYNNIRSLTQTEGQASKVAGVIVPKYITSMALLLATNLTLLGLAASLLGDDDDDDNGNGTPLLAKLPSTAFKQGVPLPNPFGDGIIYLPIGHGIGSAMWQMAASLYRTANGTNDTTGLMGDLTTIVVENTLPIQLASSKLFRDEIGDWAVLSMTPQMLKPIVELATNRNSFTGAEIVRATTPRGERDSAQGNFKMPQGYRDLAAGLYDATLGAVDMRPETIQHLSKGYFGYGPLRALDASFQDLSEATGGTRERRSEQAGALAPIAALTGFGTFVDNQSLQADILSFGVQDKAYNKLAQYGIETTDPNNKPGEAINTIVNKLTKENATPADIVFIKNTLEFTKERKALEKQFADEAKSYNEQRAKGVPADATRMQTLQANIDILTRNYVKENSKYE